MIGLQGQLVGAGDGGPAGARLAVAGSVGGCAWRWSWALVGRVSGGWLGRRRIAIAVGGQARDGESNEESGKEEEEEEAIEDEDEQ